MADVDSEQHRLTDGVSVEAIKTFLADLESEFPDTYTEMTTEDACKQLVVPRTRQDNCAYVDLLRKQLKQSPHEHVGKASVFVSHAWRYKIADVLNVLLEFAEEQRARKEDSQPVFFWFDLFMNNQNANVTASLPPEWWSTTFKESIANIGRVLLVLMPWRDPVPLTRAWCLWEIFCGIINEGTEVNIRLPKSEARALEDAIHDNWEAVTDTLVRVQAQRAEAFNPRDKDMIFEAIESWAGGFSAVNQAVKDQLRAWCLQKAVAAVEAMRSRGEDETEAFAHLCNRVGLVLDDFGDHDQAIAYYEAALALHAEARNEGKVAALHGNIGIAFAKRGECDKAIEHFEKSITIKAQTLGHKHPSTAQTYGNLGNAYANKREYDRAIEFYEKALAIKVETLGEKHPGTASTYNNLAIAYAEKGKHDEAIACYERALTATVEMLGEKHPSAADTYNNLGVAYRSQGEYKRAIGYCEKALAIRAETLGERHPSTADTYTNLGTVYAEIGEHDKAIGCFEKALAIRVATLGDKHPSTADTYNVLGNAYADKGEYAKAIASHEKAKDAFGALLGETHPNTAMALANIALVHDDCGNKEQACTSMEQALEVFSATLGPRHPFTQRAERNLQRIRGDGARNTSQPGLSQQQRAAHASAPFAGWLQKRGLWNTAFRPRWCSLDGGHLVYSKGPQLAERGRIPLATVLSAELAQDGQELHVAVPGRTFVFRLDERSGRETMLAEWCSAIRTRASERCE
ncbi:tetratricopeptide TPR_2 repeat protein [Salpingoeca rosetta]|uniref:Tetratricopeptide TPR_2 repeat protein n=1 Tax=Salpingoeca rosetta (strain ATCC 50818 / BSB-021) TaxID=946362 RepID=F2U3D4_SALR5|nr:tetratricopeptide TPR_2 repeat protein [Salpingoeca rosetta]EGD82128.1 tetratricopeptide TPR_2 repeat protein [Salpingoeca rosetta]|eukprot:XP_004996311.1 tetratricopeptide TPR_2 repeat protein [Salpingoeca rosetta]